MTTPTVAVTILLTDGEGNPFANLPVTARLDQNDVYDGFVIADSVTDETDANGIVVMNVFPNNPNTGLGTTGSSWIFSARPRGGPAWHAQAQIPNSDCDLQDVLTIDPLPARSVAQMAVDAAQAYAVAAGVSADEAQAAAAAGASYAGTIIGFNSSSLNDGAVVTFAGRSAANDGGGGDFYFSRASTQPADSVMVFAPTGGGRLFRQGWTVLGFNGPISIIWGGAQQNTDSYTAIAATLAAATNGADILVPGVFYTSQEIVKPYGKRLQIRGHNTGDCIKATASMSSVLKIDDRGPGGITSTAFQNPGSCLRDITLDANGLATYALNQLCATGFVVQDCDLKNAITEEWRIGNGDGAVYPCGGTMSFNVRAFRDTSVGAPFEVINVNRNAANMTGAAVGTPGTLPTHWASTITGDASCALSATGLATPSLHYVDLHLTATSGGTVTVYFEEVDGIPAAQNDRWTARVLHFLQARTSGTVTALVGIEERDSGGAQLRQDGIPLFQSGATGGVALSQAPNNTDPLISQEVSSTAFVQSSTAAYVRPYVKYTLAAGTDATVRICFPMMSKSTLLGPYNVHLTAGATDGQFYALNAFCASVANIRVEGAGQNYFIGAHGFGYPTPARPLINFELGGACAFSQSNADGAAIAGYHVTGFGVELSNAHSQLNVRGILVDAAIGNLAVVGGVHQHALATLKVSGGTVDAYYNVTGTAIDPSKGNVVLIGGASAGTMIPGAANWGSAAPGQYAFCFSPFGTADGFATFSFGRNADTDFQSNKAVMGFAAPFLWGGSSQRGWGGLTATSSSSTPVRLTADSGTPGGQNTWRIRSQITMMHRVSFVVTALCETGEAASWRVTGALMRTAAAPGGLSFLWGPNITQEFTSGTAAASWTLSVAADSTNASIDIEGGGVGTGGKVVRWVASIDSTEVGARAT